MKRLTCLASLLLWTCLWLPLAATAQDTVADRTLAADSTLSAAPVGEQPLLEVGLPAGLSLGAPFYGSFGYQLWPLHKGFNAQLGMSASVAFGKHSPRGVGLGQHAAFAYVHPLSSRLLFAAGLLADHTSWGSRFSVTGVSAAAMLTYRVSERLDVYAYASRRLTPLRHMPLEPYCWEAAAKERFGMGATWKINPALSLGFSVERVRSEGFNPYATPAAAFLKPYRGFDW